MYLRPSIPGFLKRAIPTWSRGKPFKDPNPPPGFPRPSENKDEIKLFALLWVEFNPAQPADFGQYQSLWTFKGTNFAIWETALNTRITARGGTPSNEILHVSGGNVELLGEVCIDLASMFDVVALGHWWPDVAVAAVKARSTAPGGTEILLWSDFESIRQARPIHAGTNQTWLGLRVKAITTATNNVYGCPVVDTAETTTPNGQTSGFVGCPHSPLHGALPAEASEILTKHRWAVDINQATISPAVAESFVEQGWVEEFDQLYPTTRPDGVIFDRVLDAPVKGTASTDYPPGWATNYRMGWQQFSVAWDLLVGPAGVPPRWGNLPIVSEHSPEDFGSRYLQDFFLDGLTQTARTVAQWQQDLERASKHGLEVVLSVRSSVDGVEQWAKSTGGPTPTVNGTWAQVVDTIRANSPASTYVAAWQTEGPEHVGAGFAFAFWQQGFRTPT